FNIDDLQRVRAATLADRLKHVPAAEAIVQQEAQKFLRQWTRRRHGPVITRLQQEFDAKRQVVVRDLLQRLNGRRPAAAKKDTERAFELFQNRVLHGPISALTESAPDESGHSLLEALRKLFRLQD